MISIITCSKSKEAFATFLSNIRETINLEYEIICIENSFGQIGICEAYNKGAKRAKFPYLCFIHEDVKFLSQNWGKILLNHFFSDNETGVIGVAGSTYKVRMVSSWWQPAFGEFEVKRANYSQSFKHKEEETKLVYFNPRDEVRSKVVSLDGVFLAVKKDVWSKFKFDDQLLKGFHGYDLDFTLRVGCCFNNYVVYDILLEHFSEGVNDKSWFQENYLVHLKNRNLLPRFEGHSLTSEVWRKVERHYLVRNFNLATEFPFKRLELIRMFIWLIISCKLFKPDIPFVKQFLKKVILT